MKRSSASTAARRRSHKRSMRLERLETRNLMYALPLGATGEDTGEYMLGRIAVIPVLFESNGQVDANTEDWNSTKIESILAKVTEGVNWWTQALDQLNTVHELEFVVDDTYARTPFSTVYEPIARRSQEAPLYITPFLRANGIQDATSLEDAVHQFNDNARQRLGTDWAYTIFIANSSSDADGSFAPGSEFNTAHAFAGGLYVVSPSTRPASTFTHESGHIFWARDEYPGGASWNDYRGYYNTQNWNAADNPTPGFVQEPSIMRSGTALQQSYDTFTMPASTRALIGWQDSDGDGIFDVLDVPLSLSGSGFYDTATSEYQFTGSATAVPLINRNSSGPQNDITLNQISRIEYRVDGGAWTTAVTVGEQRANVQFSIDVAPYQTLELRAIDDTIGITSNVLQSLGTAPALGTSFVGGFAFLDTQGEGENNFGDPLYRNITATITRADGTPILKGQIDPQDYDAGPLPSSLGGVTLTTDGVTLDGRVAVDSSQTSFQYYNLQNATWSGAWDVDRAMKASFDQTVGSVTVRVFGLTSSGSFGRIEAYDAAGQLLNRSTSSELTVGASATLTVNDSAGRIASVRIYGHQFTQVAINELQFGVATTVTTGQDGVFDFTGLPDGEYRVAVTPDKVIYAYEGPQLNLTIQNGSASVLAAGFTRVDSTWMNPNSRYDVDGDDLVQPLDALKIINEIARHGARTFGVTEAVSRYYDTTNDGAISPLDALRVINEIARQRRGGQGEGESTTASDLVFAAWSPDTQRRADTSNYDEFLYSSEEPITF